MTNNILPIAVKPQRENARGIPFSKLDPGETPDSNQDQLPGLRRRTSTSLWASDSRTVMHRSQK